MLDLLTVEDAQHFPALLRELDESLCLLTRRHERLFHNN